MLSVGKRCVMFFCVFIVFGMLLLLVVEPCVAPITVPNKIEAAPEIVSVKINSNHYWWPPSYSTNPYTGETTQTFSGKCVPTGSIDITIKNRPFTPYIDKDGNTINRYYTFFTRQGGGGDPERWWDIVLSMGPWYAIYQSDDDYTVVTVTYSNNLGVRPHFLTFYEGEVQAFRVQAVTGYFVDDGVGDDRDVVYEGVGSEPAFFEITIPVTSGTSPKPSTTTVVPVTPQLSNTDSNNNPLPPQQQFSIIILVTICIITVPLVIVMYHNKRHQHKRKTMLSSINSSNSQFIESCEVQI